MVLKKRLIIIGIVVLLIAGMSFGYSRLETTLSINGDTKVYKVKWLVNLKNVQIEEGSFLNKETEDGPARNKVELTNDNLTLNYNVTFTEAGQFFEFTVDLSNDGTLDGKLSSITTTMSDEDVGNKSFLSYLKVGVPTRDSILKPGNANTRRIRIRLEATDEIEGGEYSYTESIALNYVRNQ